MAGMVRCSLWLAAATTVFAQPAEPAFEVASVKAVGAASGGPGSNLMHGGPGTADPGRITFPAATLKRLLMAAYGVGPDQVSGPAWLDSERYAIAAKVPAGADKPQVRVMLRHLLIERFGLKLHHETRNFPSYALVVAKRGAKLDRAPAGLAKNAFPEALPGRYATAMDGTVCRLAFREFPISGLAKVLGIPLGAMAGNMLSTAPVADKTGLAGKYDFTLEFAGYMGPGGAFPARAADGAGPAAPSLFEALETQLGLKLEETKSPLDVIVIDHAGRVPAAN